jgi:GTP-binding protein
MKIKSAEFVKSSQKWQTCPEADRSEYAFIGRSNVGKSSLINAILSRKDLAKTSQTPGKTQLINHFNINDEWYLTDLPGFGYARVSKSLRKDFEKLITNYIVNRSNLVNLFILVDARHTPQAIDLEFIEWCGEAQIPFSLVFTKSDKMKPQGLADNIKAYEAKILETWEEMPTYFITSAEKKTGCPELLAFIDSTNIEIQKSGHKFEPQGE